MTSSESLELTGIFSKQTIAKVGTGTTTRRVAQIGYYFVEQLDKDTYEVRPLNNEYVPSGDPVKISSDDLLKDYTPEPEMYHQKVLPKMKELSKTLARADRYRNQGKTFSAEMEYGNALKIDIQNVRGNFGIGLCLLERGETDRANDVFARLISMNASFDKEHKHLFNEFGINLRKSKMTVQAIEYYSKALNLSQDDENLYYNLARAYFDDENYQKTREALNSALELRKDFKEAQKFIDYLDKKKLG